MGNRCIYYDANFAVEKYRGMGKYINSFVKVLTTEFGADAVGLLTGGRNISDSNYLSFGFSNYVLWEQLSMLKFKVEANDLVIFPYNTAPLFIFDTANKVLFIHDLIFLNSLNNSSLKQKFGKFYRSFIVPKIAAKFEYIITVSEYSKQEISRKLHVPADKIDVIPNSILLEAGFEQKNPGLAQRKKTIFHIGGEPDYKNSKMILYAFADLPEQIQDQYSLQMVGIRDEKIRNEYQNIASELGIYGKLELLEFQTDEEIVSLYQQASAFIFPSKEEGFGIPVIEAMKYGCPLICSESSCLPEIAGNAGIYFDPKSVPSLSNALLYCILNPLENEMRIKEGYGQVRKFSFVNFEEKVKSWYNSKFNT